MSGPCCARETDVLRAVARGWRDRGRRRRGGTRRVLRPLHRSAGRSRTAARGARARHAWRRACRRPPPCGGGSNAASARSTRGGCSVSPSPRRPSSLAAAAGGAVGVLQMAAPWLPGPGTVAADTWRRRWSGARHLGAGLHIRLDTPDRHRRGRLGAARARRALPGACGRVGVSRRWRWAVGGGLNRVRQSMADGAAGELA